MQFFFVPVCVLPAALAAHHPVRRRSVPEAACALLVAKSLCSRAPDDETFPRTAGPAFFYSQLAARPAQFLEHARTSSANGRSWPRVLGRDLLGSWTRCLEHLFS
ncbi:unnamed protein product [Prorocentrum cordatum]|uniref:Secreted protein n=1 Tax=Prorocentrum cordatum TaxID=2364126 RepID=A0ABN9UB73_9DINO|nr:unnamed protein product [Polarella glacialis]